MSDGETELTRSAYRVSNIKHERGDSRDSSTGCKMNVRTGYKGVRTGDGIRFDRETHQAYQYVIRESISFDAHSS